jgi:hypothetical protein
MFDAEKGWMLELDYLGGPICPIVKLTVASSSGSAESKYLPYFDDYKRELFVLTHDSMKSNLDINPLGDYIAVVMEFIDDYDGEIEYFEDYMIYGKSKPVSAPFEGQSIGYAESSEYGTIRYYAKTNEPTMGAPNDVSKMYGTLTGKVYDKNKQLILNDFISFAGYYNPYGPPIEYIKIDENGIYSTNVLANRFSKDYVYMLNKQIKIKSFKIDIEPDSIMEQDIYLLEDYTAIDEVTIIDNQPIRIYPNPLSDGQELRYEVDAPVKSLDCRMEIITMDGQVVNKRKITDNAGFVSLPHSLPAGMYIVNFKFNNRTQYATRLIIGK